MRKTGDLFKKIGDIKGTKMGTIKDRNCKKSNKQKILRRGSKNTQKKYMKKVLTTQITTKMWSLT